MPRGTTHWVIGTLASGNPLPLLHVDDGGVWQVDLPRGHARLIGRRVTVTGVRADFNVLDVTRIAAAAPR